jgi:hypothetical protein
MDGGMADRRSRRDILRGGLTASVAIGIAAASAAEAAGPEGTGEFLFVQTAEGLMYDGASGTLTLTGVAPQTLFFTDRPDRIAGTMTTERFVPFWSEGSDSFLSDPPNADVSATVDGKLSEVVVVLKDPRLEGTNLVYSIEVIEGVMPAAATNPSVFIDIIGMPLTPLSYAGVRRRAWRRAVLY